jgi:glycosyltransferase involved in cell wall biosynthesis
MRYLVQSTKTLAILHREKPDVIIAQNPPIVTPLIAYLYSKISRALFIIDSHTGAFTDFGRFIRLHKYLSRRALMTIVTNKDLQELVLSWGANAFVLEDRLPELPSVKLNNKFDRFSIGVVNTFSDDEPVEEILEAAKNIPDCDFYVTGRISRASPEIIKNKPNNVLLTDFLSEPAYIGLLNKVDAIMVLTKRDLTMVCGAYESIAVEKPLITSDWPVLRNYFSQGTLYVDNTPASIVKAVQEVKLRKAELRNEITALKKNLVPLWNQKFTELVNCIHSSCQPSTFNHR